MSEYTRRGNSPTSPEAATQPESQSTRTVSRLPYSSVEGLGDFVERLRENRLLRNEEWDRYHRHSFADALVEGDALAIVAHLMIGCQVPAEHVLHPPDDASDRDRVASARRRECIAYTLAIGVPCGHAYQDDESFEAVGPLCDADCRTSSQQIDEVVASLCAIVTATETGRAVRDHYWHHTENQLAWVHQCDQLIGACSECWCSACRANVPDSQSNAPSRAGEHVDCDDLLDELLGAMEQGSRADPDKHSVERTGCGKQDEGQDGIRRHNVKEIVTRAQDRLPSTRPARMASEGLRPTTRRLNQGQWFIARGRGV